MPNPNQTFNDAFDKAFLPLIKKKLEEKRLAHFGPIISEKESPKMLKEPYRELSKKELSDLVLEGVEIFEEVDVHKTKPHITVRPDAQNTPNLSYLVKQCASLGSTDIIISRHYKDPMYWVHTNTNIYKVFDNDLNVLKQKAHMYFDEILIPYA